MIRICEVFKSIQGEGLTVGSPSLFIRTGRCSVGCKFCDTKFSWDSGREYSVEELLKTVVESSLPEVVITGGEPLEEEELPELLSEISKLSEVRRITLETCGHTFRELPKEKLHLVVSPKPPTMGVEFPSSEVRKFLREYEDVELKFTVFSKEDLAVVEGFLRETPCVPEPIVIQPLETPLEDYPKTCKRIVNLLLSRKEFIKKYEVRVIPQVHKFIGVK